MLSQAQRTIIDYNDAVAVNLAFTPRKALTQIKSWTAPDVYSLGVTSFIGTPTASGSFPALTITPHANNQQITPSMYKAGSSTDLLALAQAASGIDDVKWTILDSSIATKLEYLWNKTNSRWQKSVDGAAYADITDYYKDSTVGWFNPRAPFDFLIIADIVQDSKPMTLYFECSYTDPSTSLKMYAKTVITVQMVTNSQTTPYIYLFPPDGEWIRNGAPASVRLIAQIFRNGGMDLAWETATVEWFVYDSTHAADDGAGAYWDKLSHSSGVTEISTVDSVTGIGTGGNQLKIFDQAVVGTEVYKVKIVENGITYYATANVTDLTDALLCNVASSNGDILRNGLGSTVLSAYLYNGAGEVDNAGSVYAYAWQTNDQLGAKTYFRSLPYHSTTLSALVAQGANAISVAAVGTATNINSLTLGDILVIDPGTTSEEIIAVHSSTAISGAGPYAVTLAANLVKPHSASAVVRVIAKKPITTTVSGGGNGLTIQTTTYGFLASAVAPAIEIVRIGSGDSAIYRKVVSVAGSGTYTLTLDLAVGNVNGLALVRATELQYGKTVGVNADDVTNKNTFICMVS